MSENPEMNIPAETKQKPELRDYLAAERTFLAWIRTGLALMGFGFVVARFGLFLQQVRVFQGSALSSPSGPSLWFGTSLIIVGVILDIASALQHVRLIRDLNRGAPVATRPSVQAVLIAIFLALVGLAMAIYLISVRSSGNIQSESKEEGIVASTMNAPSAGNGIVTISSNHSVDQTVEKLKDILRSKGVTLFALVDHSGEAEKVGMKMPPTKLLIFGSPKAGTPLMLAAPSIAIDLPLKILVSEDAGGKVRVSYNSAEYLKNRYDLPADLLQNIAVVETLANKAAE